MQKLTLKLTLFALIALLMQPASAQEQSQQAKKKFPWADKLKRTAEQPRVRTNQNANNGTGGATYTFIGRGNWSLAANWENKVVPPSRLNTGDNIVINGTCLFNNTKSFTLRKDNSLIVNKGKELILTIGNNLFVNGGTVTNKGKLTVLSGTLSTSARRGGQIQSSGEIKLTRLSKNRAEVKPIPVNN